MTVDELAKRVADNLNSRKRATDYHGWARRIMQRHARGETLPRISLDYAREVLGLREP